MCPVLALYVVVWFPILFCYSLKKQIIKRVFVFKSGGQMVVTDMAESEKRVGALGKLAISYGVGMVVGPFVGGLLAKFFG